MQETWVQPRDWEDPLEKEMVTHSSILAWALPWTEEPGGLQSTGLPDVGGSGGTRGEGGRAGGALFLSPGTLWMHPLGQPPGGEQVGRVM